MADYYAFTDETGQELSESEHEKYHRPTENELKRVKTGTKITVDWNGQGKVSYTVFGKNDKGLKVKDPSGKELVLPYKDYDSISYVMKEAEINDESWVNDIEQEYIEMAEREIENRSEFAQNVAIENGQMFDNVANTSWFVKELAKELEVADIMSESDDDLNEEDVSTTNSYLEKITAAVESASSFMNIGAKLKEIGIDYHFSTNMFPIYTIEVDGKQIAVINKKYADGAEKVVGDVAIGFM